MSRRLSATSSAAAGVVAAELGLRDVANGFPEPATADLAADLIRRLERDGYDVVERDRLGPGRAAQRVMDLTLERLEAELVAEGGARDTVVEALSRALAGAAFAHDELDSWARQASERQAWAKALELELNTLIANAGTGPGISADRTFELRRLVDGLGRGYDAPDEVKP